MVTGLVLLLENLVELEVVNFLNVLLRVETACSRPQDGSNSFFILDTTLYRRE